MAVQLKIKSILKEQVPNAPEWLDRLLLPLNDVILSTGAALNKNLTFTDNMAAQIKTLTITTGPGWHNVGDTGEPAFQNSWVNYDSTHEAVSFRKVNGYVEIRGVVKSGSSINTTIFTLPSGYVPAKTVNLATNSNNAYGSLRIETTGNVTAVTGSTSAFAVNCRYTPSDITTIVESPYPITFQSTLASRATGCVCLAATPTTGVSTSVALPGPLSVDFVDAGNKQIIVKQIYGLVPSTTYNVILLLTTR